MKEQRTPTESHFVARLVEGETSKAARVVVTAALLMRLGKGLPPGPVVTSEALALSLRAETTVWVMNDAIKVTSKSIGEIVCVYSRTVRTGRLRKDGSTP